MVTLRRPPQSERPGPKLEPYQVILRPMITEKATRLSERHNAYTFEVNPLATKTEMAAAITTAVAPLPTKADVETAKQQAITAATNGRPNRSEMNAAIATAIAPLAAKADLATAVTEIQGLRTELTASQTALAALTVRVAALESDREVGA